MNPSAKIAIRITKRLRLRNANVYHFTESRSASNSHYEQIPEYLKIHMFSPELEIIKTDELKSPFKNFSGDYILKLLEKRANEVRLDINNSNPYSRMNDANIVRFMKVAARLKQLFAINGGNTEVLDAIIQSQSTLDAFEAKLAAKKAAKRPQTQAPVATKAVSKTPLVKNDAKATDLKVSELKAQVEPVKDSKKSDLYSGPYLQIPEKLQIHEFANELKLFRDHELHGPYSGISAADLIKLMDERIKEVHSGSDSGQGISSANLVSFYNLRSKLNKLLVWNGGVTSVLDTILHSQDTFEKFESGRKQMKKAPVLPPAPVYKQLPDNVKLDEYIQELSVIRKDLDRDFEKATSFEVLTSVSRIANSDIPMDKKLAFNKLYRNLVSLFSYNGNQTFVLDKILLNAVAFQDLESKLEKRTKAGSSAPTTKYRNSDYIISLLNSQNNESIEPQDEVSIRSAVVHSMSPEERKVYESNPEELDSINKLTAHKIREQYGKPTAEAAPHLEKSDVEKFLKKIKKEKDTAEEQKWREREAFEWSKRLASSQRTLEKSNFFNPIANGKSQQFPMFPGNDNDIEYLVLAPGGQQFVFQENPLGVSHVPQNMFDVLESIPESELRSYSKNIEKLRKKGWKLIGGGQNGELLVLAKKEATRKDFVFRLIRVALISSAATVASLMLVNLWVDEEAPVAVEQEPILPKEDIEPVPQKSWKSYLWSK